MSTNRNDLSMVIRKLSDIQPYDKNPRNNKQAVDAVAESIRQCGYVTPIVIDENNIILAGHTRYKALKKLGRKEVECIVKENLTEDQKKKYRLLDNKTNELAEWDMDLLAEELAGLDFGSLDLDWGVIEKPEKAEVVEDDYDKAPPEEPRSKYGQVWQLGRHRVMCGDSTKLADVQKLMGGQLADLLLTDPPYNVDYTGKTADALKIQNDKMEDSNFREFLKAAFNCARKAMKPGACFYIWHADMESANFRIAAKESGLEVRQCLIWVKNSIVMGRQDYHWKHEPCLYGWKEGAAHLWAADRKQSTILNFDRPTRNNLHPTMKPVPLFDYQICNNTKGNDIVLDLFGGSGTTIIACEQNGRAGYLMEYDPKYVDVIIDRWEQFTGEEAVLISD